MGSLWAKEGAVDYEFDLSLEIGDPTVVAEVIGSTVRILFALKLSFEDIANIFTAAADDLRSHKGEESIVEVTDDIQAESALDLYDLDFWFENQSTAKSLKRLGKRLERFHDIEDEETSQKVLDIIINAIRLRDEALTALRDEAVKLGFIVAADRDEWLSSATDAELDLEDNVVFLDDYRYTGDFYWGNVLMLSDYYLIEGAPTKLQQLSSALISSKIPLDSRLLTEVSQKLKSAEELSVFSEFIEQYRGAGEIMQAEFLDAFNKKYGCSSGTSVLEAWLSNLDLKGVLQRYKRSNRWRIKVG
ncbi:MAG: hypothetical protein H3C38_10140 [Rhodospirillales bacterium]|nr:hypothetical protein [Rhodospirillales bacterium]